MAFSIVHTRAYASGRRGSERRRGRTVPRTRAAEGGSGESAGASRATPASAKSAPPAGRTEGRTNSSAEAGIGASGSRRDAPPGSTSVGGRNPKTPARWETASASIRRHVSAASSDASAKSTRSASHRSASGGASAAAPSKSSDHACAPEVGSMARAPRTVRHKPRRFRWCKERQNTSRSTKGARARSEHKVRSLTNGTLQTSMRVFAARSVTSRPRHPSCTERSGV